MPRRFAGPKSPHDLIQERYPHDGWAVLVCCLMLNCTTRAQMERVIGPFLERWPTPYAVLSADSDEMAEVVRSLGFKNRRTERIKRLAGDIVALGGGPITRENVRSLHGVGEYGARAYEIFCLGVLGAEPPEDHSLVKYYEWALANPDAYATGWSGDV